MESESVQVNRGWNQSAPLSSDSPRAIAALSPIIAERVPRDVGKSVSRKRQQIKGIKLSERGDEEDNNGEG